MVLLHDALHRVRIVVRIHKAVVHLLQENVGRQKDEIIAVPLPHHLMNVARDAQELLLAPSRIFARDVVRDQQRFLSLIERRSGIDLIVRRLAA